MNKKFSNHEIGLRVEYEKDINQFKKEFLQKHPIILEYKKLLGNQQQEIDRLNGQIEIEISKQSELQLDLDKIRGENDILTEKMNKMELQLAKNKTKLKSYQQL